MMRANLLPRPKERVGFGALDVDAEYLRQALFGLALVAIVTFTAIGIESFRVSRLEAAIADQDRAIEANAPMRARVKALALDVARFQSFERQAREFRRSGADAAIALARIGNSVPDHVWLTALDHQATGYDVVGAARSVDQLGGTMLGLGRALPSAAAKLVNIDNRERSGNVHFTARVAASPTPSADAVQTAPLTGASR